MCHSPGVKHIRNVTVGGREYGVYTTNGKETPSTLNTRGLCDPAAAVIYLDETYAETVQQGTLFHELIHAALFANDLGVLLESFRGGTEEILVLGLESVLRPALLSAGWKEPPVNAPVKASK